MDANFVLMIREANEQSLERLRHHTFVRLAHGRELSKEQAHRWIMAASYDSRAFRDQLQAGVARLVKQPEYKLVYRILKENLDDENGRQADGTINPEEAHWRHYIHLVQQIGYTEDELLNYEGSLGVQYAIQLAHNVPSWNVASWVGYMLVNEGATPITYDAEDVALRVYHPELETKFFRLHVEVDQHHVAELYKAVALLSNSAFYGVLQGILLGELGMAAILDEALGLFG